MRLHRLELSAIGPFASEQHIDFDELGAGGLFLLDGPTGAGKSTVLDAITFALYGAGRHGGDGRLHSHFAQPGDQPRVVLEFSIRGARYLITRTPEFVRPKRRGDGTTVVAASAHLQRWHGSGWESISSNKAEIADVLDDTIGLTREQFNQVVLLPQGEFAAFLRAGDDERRDVLSRLFGTQLYQRVTDELEARRQVATRELAAATDRVRARVAAAGAAAGLDAPGRDELCDVPASDRDLRLAGLDRELAAAAADCTRERDDAARALAESRQRHDAAAGAAKLVRRYAQAVAELEALQQGEQEAAQLRSALSEAQRAEPVRALLAAAADAAKAMRRAAIDGVAADVAVVQAKLDDVCVELARHPDELAAAEAALARAQAAHELVRFEPQVAAATGAVRLATDRHQQAVDRHQALVEARLAGMAAELAGGLLDAEPCPVCGSCEHPSPAQPNADAVGAVELSDAARSRKERERDRLNALGELAGLEQRLAVLRAAAGLDGAGLAPLVPSGTPRELTTLVQALGARGRELSLLDRQLRELLVAVQTHEAAQARAAAEAASVGFASLQRAVDAVRTPQERDEMASTLVEWERTMAAASAALADAEFDPLRSWSASEIAEELGRCSDAELAAAHAVAEYTARHTAATRAADRAVDAHARFVVEASEVAAADAEHAALAAELEPVIHLARLARGMAGRRRVALTTYVLRHWFNHVVAAANVRLRSISSGRYELVRVDEGESKNERAGLTLHVIDAHTGEARTPRSLSGGETFYTSLALALGLADVVRAEAGGADLDTLFIDEGFGTLDPETLSQVMDVIDDLRDGGRVVGVVSHVAELKERIPERLEVRRLADGSSTLRVVA